jgi:cysteine desulfurase
VTLPIYLDFNASTPVLPEVLEAMLPHLTSGFGNPSSGHAFGRLAREAIEAARAEVAELLGCQADELLFTGGGTESSNLAIRGIAASRDRPTTILTTCVEHPATAEPCRALERVGWRVAWIGVDATGRARLDEAEQALRDAPEAALVTVIHAQNETGALQPVRAIADLARSLCPGVVVHSDAAQSVGKIAARVDELGVDLLSVAGHKLYAPKGVGALYLRRGTMLAPVSFGAGHERGLRPGTENVAGIVGLGRACAIARASLEREATRVRALRDELERRLRAAVPGLALNGHPDERLPGTLNLRFPIVRGSALLAAAPEVAASTGSACHEAGERASSVLTAAGVDPEAALGSVRLSLGRTTTADQVERAAQALARAYRSLTGERG